MMTFLFIHSKCSNNLHLPTSDSQSIPLPPHIPLGNHKSVLYVYGSVSVLWTGSFAPYFRFHIKVIAYGIFFSFWFTSLRMIISICIHFAANGIISFFLMAEEHAIVCMHHLLHSSADGHLGCLHVLAIVNSATMSIGVRVYFWTIVLSRYNPTRGLLDHMVALFLVFCGTSMLFPIVAAPTYLPTNRVGGFEEGTFLNFFLLEGC